MLHPRVEQVAGAGLHHRLQAQLAQLRRHAVELGLAGRHRIEVAGVRRDRHRLVAMLGQQLQGIVEAMVLQAVGLVAEAHPVQRVPPPLRIWFSILLTLV